MHLALVEEGGAVGGGTDRTTDRPTGTQKHHPIHEAPSHPRSTDHVHEAELQRKMDMPSTKQQKETKHSLRNNMDKSPLLPRSRKMDGSDGMGTGKVR